MRWTVVWVKEAEEMLANLWLNTSDKPGVSEAANRIDLLLRTNPECGQHYDQELKVLICSPLAVIFELDEPNRIVRILGVESFR